MICCFRGSNEQGNVRDLVKHFDTEIEKAILFGCTVFVSGNNTPEDKLFEERVRSAGKKYQEGEINFVGLSATADELELLSVYIADWEICNQASE